MKTALLRSDEHTSVNKLAVYTHNRTIEHSGFRLGILMTYQDPASGSVVDLDFQSFLSQGVGKLVGRQRCEHLFHLSNTNVQNVQNYSKAKEAFQSLF